VHAAGPRAQPGVHLEEAADLVHDVVEVPRLVAVGRLGRVAVHRVALPDHAAGAALVLDRLDDRRQHVAHLPRTHPGDQGQPSRLQRRVEPLAQLDRPLGGRRRAELDPDRVVQPAQQLDVRAVEVAGPLADPDHVRRQVVRAALLVRTGQRPLVLQQQRLVAAPQLDAVGLRGGLEVQAAGAHEGQRPLDVGRQRLVAVPGRAVLHEGRVPLVHGRQVGAAVGGHRPHEVHRGGAVGVGPDHPGRVGGALTVQVVDRVAPVGGQPRRGLQVSAARLGVLPGQPAHLDHRDARAVGQDHGHLQQGADLAADAVGGVGGEGLGAVAALQQEGLPARDVGQPGAQRVALPRLDQRRHLAERLEDVGQGDRVGPVRLLQRRQLAPPVEVQVVRGGHAARE